MADLKTFWLEPTHLVRVALRRYGTGADNCAGREGYYCNGETVIEAAAPSGDWPHSGDDEERIPHADPRWPKTCDACGRSFTDADSWQIFVRTLYSGAPGGELSTLLDAAPGAMWDASWLGEDRCGPDGIHLVVKLPNGLDWMPDGPAANSKAPHGWKRTGDPRKANVTASPSIGSPWPPGSPRYYHGWLRDGILKDAG